MNLKQMNVESFNLDHTKVVAPYVRLAGVTEGLNGDKIFKYDLRFCQPNQEHLDMPSIHSLEHMMAEFSRNHSDKVVDISPMGCQTGYYMALINHEDYDDVLTILEKTLYDVLDATEVPACNEVQCGWAASHSLDGAKNAARTMLEKKDEWTKIFA